MKFNKWLSTQGSIIEDKFRMGRDAGRVRRLLGHWNEQHDYFGTSWDGVLKLHRQLVKGTMEAAFESVGWYKYKSSTKKEGMDGKDWRIVLTEFDPLVVVNCHSCINEDVWTLATTVFSTHEVDRKKLKIITDDDPEVCALMWSIETAKILETDGYEYSEAIARMEEELKKARLKDSR